MKSERGRCLTPSFPGSRLQSTENATPQNATQGAFAHVFLHWKQEVHLGGLELLWRETHVRILSSGSVRGIRPRDPCGSGGRKLEDFGEVVPFISFVSWGPSDPSWRMCLAWALGVDTEWLVHYTAGARTTSVGWSEDERSTESHCVRSGAKHDVGRNQKTQPVIEVLFPTIEKSRGSSVLYQAASL